MTRLVSLLSSLSSWAKANPALAAGAVSVLVTVLARLGFRLDANDMTLIAALAAAISHGLVHLATTPAGKHEDAAREAHG